MHLKSIFTYTHFMMLLVLSLLTACAGGDQPTSKPFFSVTFPKEKGEQLDGRLIVMLADNDKAPDVDSGSVWLSDEKSR